jgi:hypothetical protein
MAIQTRVIVQGAMVMAPSIREGVAQSGKPYKITSAIIVGQDCMAEVSMGDLTLPKIGEQITLQCEVSSYRDEDQLRAVKYVG